MITFALNYLICQSDRNQGFATGRQIRYLIEIRTLTASIAIVTEACGFWWRQWYDSDTLFVCFILRFICDPSARSSQLKLSTCERAIKQLRGINKQMSNSRRSRLMRKPHMTTYILSFIHCPSNRWLVIFDLFHRKQSIPIRRLGYFCRTLNSIPVRSSHSPLTRVECSPC